VAAQQVAQQASEIFARASKSPEVYIGVLTLLLTIFLPLLHRSRRNLFFDIIAESKLDGSSNGTLFVIDVRNAAGRVFGWISGGTDIPAAHYERPLSFSFGANARVREADVVEERPHGIGARVSIDCHNRDKLVLDPVLLNEGDLVRFKAVVEEPVSTKKAKKPQQDIAQDNVNADGRVVGVKRIEKKRSSKELSKMFVLLTIFGAVLLGPVVLVFELLGGHESEYWIFRIYVALHVTSAVLASFLLGVVMAREIGASRIMKALRSSYPTSERVSGIKQMLESIAYKKPSNPGRESAIRFMLVGLLSFLFWLLFLKLGILDITNMFPSALPGVLSSAFLLFQLEGVLEHVLGIVIMLLVAMGLERLDAVQRGSYGRYGHYGFYVVIVAIAIGMVLMAWAEWLRYVGFLKNHLFLWTNLAVSLGFVLYGAATLRAGVLPRWYGLALILYGVAMILAALLQFSDITHVMQSWLAPDLLLFALGIILWRRSPPQ
jgi:hypothetical protein